MAIYTFTKKDEKGKNITTYGIEFYYRDKLTGKLIKKRKRGFSTRGAAKKFKEKFLLNMETNINISFATLVDLYLEDCEAHLKPTTVEYKKNIFYLRILPFFKNLKITEIEPLHIRRWQIQLLNDEKQLKQTYLRSISNQLNAILNYAVKYYKLPNNPARFCDSIGEKYAEEMLFWTKEEFFKFREKIKDKEMSKIIFNLFFYTGMREGELLALTLDDFNLEKKEVSINKNLAKVGKKELILPPKTKGSKRIITIPEFLCNQIKEFSKKRYDYNSNERLFPVTKYYLHHEMNRGSKLSGVKRIRIHDLRHSHVALLIEMGVSILLISKRLGHDNPQTTLRIYGHLYPNKQREIADDLEILENIDFEKLETEENKE